MSSSHIIDQSSHDWRTELPNIIFNLGLNPYELALYCEYKRVAGDRGSCIKSNKNIAKSCNMSVSTVQRAKATLSMPRPELEGQPLIKVSKRTTDLGDPDTDQITITDVWGFNFQSYLEKKIKKQNKGGVSQIGGSCLTDMRVVSDRYEGGVSQTDKEEHSKKIPFKKDNVCTMSCSKEKVDNRKTRFLNKLTKEQKELHDRIVAFKPNWGKPPESEEVCAWFLAKKYTTAQVSSAFEVYQQDAAEARGKGKTIDNMGGYIVSAIKSQRILKNQDFEANKQMAKAACKDIPEMRVLDKYVSYTRGYDEIQIMYNLPIETFTDQLSAARRSLLMEWET